MRKTFWEEQTRRKKNLVYNPNHINILSCRRLNSIKLETRNKNPNFTQKSFKTTRIPKKFNFSKNLNFLINTSRNEKKLSLNNEIIPFHGKNFIKQFEGLFQQITNNSIFDYCNGFEMEKMGDFAKTIKEYNSSDYIRKLKKKNSKNKQNKSKYNPKNTITQKSYWSRPHSSNHYKKNKNEKEKENCIDAYLSTASTIRYSLTNFKYDNDNKSCSMFTHKKNYGKTNFLRNRIDRIKLFENKNSGKCLLKMKYI
jgi:hypothetical protein